MGDKTFIYPVCCKDQMRYPIGMDLYQNRPVRKIEHEKGEGKSLLSPITTLPPRCTRTKHRPY